MADTAHDSELVVILSPEIADDSVAGSLEKLSEAVTTRGGEIVDTNQWGRRRLAYPIKRHMEGNYIVSQVKLDPAKVPDLEANLRISDEVLRHLIIRAGE